MNQCEEIDTRQTAHICTYFYYIVCTINYFLKFNRVLCVVYSFVVFGKNKIVFLCTL